MPRTRDRLSFRIPWLIEAVAEGRLAIIVSLVLADIVLGGRRVIKR